MALPAFVFLSLGGEVDATLASWLSQSVHVDLLFPSRDPHSNAPHCGIAIRYGSASNYNTIITYLGE